MAPNSKKRKVFKGNYFSKLAKQDRRVSGLKIKASIIIFKRFEDL